MNFRRSLPLVTGLSALLVLGSLSVTACSSVESTAIRVNGQSLSGADFDELLSGYAAAIPSAENESGTVNASVARGLLSDWATTVVLTESLASRDISVTEDDLLEAQGILGDQAGFGDASPAAQDFYVRATAVQRVFAAAFGPSTAELRDLYEAGPAESGAFCLRAILVTDETLIADISNQLASGTDFGELAARYSLDSSAANGGVVTDPGSGLGCFDRVRLSSQIVPEFAVALSNAEVAVPTPPFEIPGVGWVIALLRPFDEVADDGRELVGLGASESARQDALSAADVWIGSEYGVWDSRTGRVVAP
ncbi:MAG: peptidylprolyl isomerase [Ilumatobacteraceae bacterium]